MIVKKYIGLSLVLLILSACATVVSPTGGPKDTTAPVVIEAVPANRNTHFQGKKIELSFDEYVTLNNASQEVLVSPPLATKPDIKLSGKTVTIKFKEALKPDATYTIHFGNAIKDLHEGNVFKDYVYTFSTGDCLDSLSMTGKIINADDEKPADGMFVMLYNEDADSLLFQPTLRAPDFIAKTDKEGAFRFEGLPDKCFLVFALSDVNSNFYYDMHNEKVAFIDTLVPADAVDLKLQAFVQEDTNQMLLEKKLVEEGVLRFVFRHPADRVQFTFPEVTADSFQMVKVWSKERDTLCCYFTPNVIDSLEISIKYDTIIDDQTKYSLKYREPQQRRGKTDKYMNVTPNIHNKKLRPKDDFVLRFSEPVVEVRPYDTLCFAQADDYGMKYCLVTEIDDTTSYSVNLPDSIFFSFRGRTNDTLSFQFKRAQHNDYGNIFIKIAPAKGAQAVIQLLDSHDKMVDQRVIDTLQKVEFLQLLPDSYKLRAVIDADRNGKWSTGNYHRFFLPEKTLLYKDKLDVKAGWDMDLEEVWDLSR